jgi:hypothetical protein
MAGSAGGLLSAANLPIEGTHMPTQIQDVAPRRLRLYFVYVIRFKRGGGLRFLYFRRLLIEKTRSCFLVLIYGYDEIHYSPPNTNGR